MRRVIFNQKGGVGKTSITCNLAAVAASRGKRVLVMDLDSQANATQYLLGNLPAVNSMADFLDQPASFFAAPRKVAEFVVKSPFENLSVLPSSPRLQEIEHKLESRYKIFSIRKALEELETQFDEIYIDTPPALNFYTKSALIATQRVLIPFDCDAFSRLSLDTVANAIYEIREDHNRGLVIEGVIVNQYQPRANLPQLMVAELQGTIYPIMQVMLGSSVKMRESHQAASPLIYFAPRHALTQQFVELYDSL